MQSSTGQYSTQAGDPAQPVQHSVITASSFGFFLRGVVIPFERGSCLSSMGMTSAVLSTSGSVAISCTQILLDSGARVRAACARGVVSHHTRLIGAKHPLTRAPDNERRAGDRVSDGGSGSVTRPNDRVPALRPLREAVIDQASRG